MLPSILAVTVKDVEWVYSGRPGCGCGCRGKYSKNRIAIGRILKYLKNRPNQVEVFQPSGQPIIFALENDARYRWVCLKEG